MQKTFRLCVGLVFGIGFSIQAEHAVKKTTYLENLPNIGGSFSACMQVVGDLRYCKTNFPEDEKKNQALAKRIETNIKRGQPLSLTQSSSITTQRASLFGPQATGVFRGECFVDGQKKDFTLFIRQHRYGYSKGAFLWGDQRNDLMRTMKSRISWRTLRYKRPSKFQATDDSLSLPAGKEHGKIEFFQPRVTKKAETPKEIYLKVNGEDGKTQFCKAVPTGFEDSELWQHQDCRVYHAEGDATTRFLPIQMNGKGVQGYFRTAGVSFQQDASLIHLKSKIASQKKIGKLTVTEAFGTGEVLQDSRPLTPHFHLRQAEYKGKKLTTIAIATPLGTTAKSLFNYRYKKGELKEMELAKYYSDGSHLLLSVYFNPKTKDLRYQVRRHCKQGVPGSPFVNFPKLNNVQVPTKDDVRALALIHPLAAEWFKDYVPKAADPKVAVLNEGEREIMEKLWGGISNLERLKKQQQQLKAKQTRLEEHLRNLGQAGSLSVSLQEQIQSLGRSPTAIDRRRKQELEALLSTGGVR